MARVCVVIPAYNPGPYLREAVKSVLAQTCTDWELLIVDDGSSEDLSQILREFPMAKLIRQSNRGVAIARNVGILNSHSEFIAFLDADDLWRESKLQRQLEVMEADNSVALCYTEFDNINASGNSLGPGPVRNRSSYLELIEECSIWTSTVMLRRSCLADCGLFDPLLTMAEDTDLWLKIARLHKIQLLPSCEVSYRIHENNATRNFQMQDAALKEVLRRHQFFAHTHSDKSCLPSLKIGARHVDTARGAQLYKYCRSDLHDRQFGSFLSNFAGALIRDPRLVARSLYCWLLKRLRAPEKWSIPNSNGQSKS
jgi:glycosyltransferase involved in cell wall biosynthesis